jgi:hypothetical protein
MLRIATIVLFTLTAVASAQARSGHFYGGGQHTYSHGGTYVGGVGSSHQGGHYIGPYGGYGRHK